MIRSFDHRTLGYKSKKDPKRDDQAQKLYEARGNYMSSSAARRAKGYGPLKNILVRDFWYQPSQKLYDFHIGVSRKMIVSVIHDDGTENEFELELCCIECAAAAYKWTPDQYLNILNNYRNKTFENVPTDVNSSGRFIDFVRSKL